MKTLARTNETGRALRAVNQTIRVRVTDDVVKELIGLYPNDGRADQQQENVDMEDQTIDIESLTDLIGNGKELRRLPRLSEPGPLRSRNEHISLLAQSYEFGDQFVNVLAGLPVGNAP